MYFGLKYIIITVMMRTSMEDNSLPLRLMIFFLLLFVAFAEKSTNAAETTCPENSYELDRTEINNEISIYCKCIAGFNSSSGVCKREIPESALKKGIPFLVDSKAGDVKAFLVAGGQRFPVNLDEPSIANVFITGKRGKLVILLPNGKRIYMAPDSDLILGDPLTEFDLDILSASGFFRFDTVHEKSALEKLKKTAEVAFVKARWWFKKTVSKRCTIHRISYLVSCVRGTDYVVKGDKEGNLEIIIIDGVVDLLPKNNETTITLTAGEHAAISKLGKIKVLEKVDPVSIVDDWRQRINF